MRGTRGKSLMVCSAATLILLMGLLSLAGCDDVAVRESSPKVATDVVSAKHSSPAGIITIHQPTETLAIATGVVDEHGRPVMANCGTCHATRPPNAAARIGSPLVLFHQGLNGPHGNLTCLSCHHPDDGYRSLRLADGQKLPLADVMTLCAQCHGPQYRDYQKGAHGGMVGYWDLSKGGRERNNCVDCHQPHAPAFPRMQPAPGPKDRFLKGARHE